MESSAKNKASTPQLWQYHLPFAVVPPHSQLLWSFTLIYLYWWGESVKGLSKSPFLAINAKGGESIKPKAKGPHHHHFKFFKIKFKLEFISIDVFSNWHQLISISKPSWKLRGEFHSRGVLFSQKKSIWNRGEKFQILKMLLAILFIYPWLFAKDFEKIFQKNLQKHTCGAKVVQNIK
jgi:hypothetical protein